VGRFEFALRERVQTTFRTDSVNRYEKMNPEMILRSRLSAEYNIRHSKWTPYLLFELHNTLNAPAVVLNYKRDPYSIDNYTTRYRAGVGAKFKVTRNHRLDFYYYFDYDRSYNIDYKGNKGDLKSVVQENEIRHIFGISYKFKL
jgi:opacity protein-like surface antigen